MKTIVVANQKGGSGKSTIAVHLAAAAEHAGHGPVILSDTDPQGTSGDWFNQRKKSGFDTPLYAPLALSELRDKIRALGEAGAAYLFVDTAPSIGAVNADLFAVADLILIPLNPTPADLRALVKGLPLGAAIRQAVQLRAGSRPAQPEKQRRGGDGARSFGAGLAIADARASHLRRDLRPRQNRFGDRAQRGRRSGSDRPVARREREIKKTKPMKERM